MHAAPTLRLPTRRLLVGTTAFVLAVPAIAAGAGPSTPPCPLSVGEVSAAVGRTVQRVSLGDPKADPDGQCAFAVVVKGKPATPQVYLTTFAGGVADLRQMSAYYVQSRSKLATKPRVALRPDLGPGAFTLTATGIPVTTLYAVVGKGTVGALAIDLTDGPSGKRELQVFEKLFALALGKSR